jgi:phosphoadenosine phosphosulfate reductase
VHQYHNPSQFFGCSLQEKVRVSRECIRVALERVESAPAAVAWTGGKDSTVVLSLYREILRESGDIPLALNLDTGCKFPEVTSFRDELAEQWDIRLHVLKPWILFEGYPLAVDKVACCRELKIEPLRKGISDHGIRLLFSGIRHDEHSSRSAREMMEERHDPDYLLCNPILHWSEMDVWSFHSLSNLPYCRLYERGYRSLGCVPCTVPVDGSGGERSGRSREKEEQLELLKSLGYF